MSTESSPVLQAPRTPSVEPQIAPTEEVATNTTDTADKPQSATTSEEPATKASSKISNNPFLKSLKKCPSYTQDDASESYSTLYSLVNAPCFDSATTTLPKRAQSPPLNTVKHKKSFSELDSLQFHSCVSDNSANSRSRASSPSLQSLCPPVTPRSTMVARTKSNGSPSVKFLATNLRSRLASAIQKVDWPKKSPSRESTPGCSSESTTEDLQMLKSAQTTPQTVLPTTRSTSIHNELSPSSTNSLFSSINTSSSSNSDSSDSSDSDSDSDSDLDLPDSSSTVVSAAPISAHTDAVTRTPSSQSWVDPVTDTSMDTSYSDSPSFCSALRALGPRANDDRYFSRVYKDIRRKRLKRSNDRANYMQQNYQQQHQLQQKQHVFSTPVVGTLSPPLLTPTSPSVSGRSALCATKLAAAATAGLQAETLSSSSSPVNALKLQKSGVSSSSSTTAYFSPSASPAPALSAPITSSKPTLPLTSQSNSPRLSRDHLEEEDVVAESLIWLGTGSIA